MSSNVSFAQQAPGAEGYTVDHPAAEHIRIVDAREGRIAWTRKKIAICGFASSTTKYIPINDATWTIFCLNQLYRHLPRVDVHFDIHSYWEEGNVEGTDHAGWLAACEIPVIMSAPDYARVPTAVQYPIDRLIAKHGIDYFTSTIALELAFALDLIDTAVEARAKQIPMDGLTLWEARDRVRALYQEYTVGIFGVDLIVGTEYFVQKACAEFWIGQLESRGIFILLPPEAALLKQTHRYGWDREPNVGLVPLSEYMSRAAMLAKKRDDAMAMIHTFSGAVQELERIHTMQPTATDMTDRLKNLTEERAKAIALANTLDGAAQENRHAHDIIELRARGGAIPLTG